MQHYLTLVAHGGMLAAVIGGALIVFVSLIPIFPIPVIAAAIGAVFPPWSAVLISWSAATIGALIKFYVVRFMLQRHAERYVRKYRRVENIVTAVEKNAFWTIFGLRLLPVFPSSLINIGASLTRTPMRIFTLATALGKLPTMFVFTVIGHELQTNWLMSMILMVLYGIVILYAGFRIHRQLRIQQKSAQQGSSS